MQVCYVSYQYRYQRTCDAIAPDAPSPIITGTSAHVTLLRLTPSAKSVNILTRARVFVNPAQGILF